MRTPLFTGVCPALITPFHESGSIDFHSLARLIDRQISAGVDAICICGTTGESSALSKEERNDLIKFCVSHVDGRVKILAGTGSNNTSVTIELSCNAQELGADGLLIVTPYYNKTTQTGLIEHYEAIADNIDLPMILYNVPSRTGISFSAETYARLAENPKFNGIKEASGSLSLVTQTKALCGDDFYIWSGNDDQVVPMMSLGAVGVISAVCNLIPESMIQMSHLCLKGCFADAASLQIRYAELIDALFLEVNPIPIKHAMNLLDMDSGYLRLPLCSMSPINAAKLHAAMQRLELLA